jgi:hypothetical protein
MSSQTSTPIVAASGLGSGPGGKPAGPVVTAVEVLRSLTVRVATTMYYRIIAVDSDPEDDVGLGLGLEGAAGDDDGETRSTALSQDADGSGTANGVATGSVGGRSLSDDATSTAAAGLAQHHGHMHAHTAAGSSSTASASRSGRPFSTRRRSFDGALFRPAHDTELAVVVARFSRTFPWDCPAPSALVSLEVEPFFDASLPNGHVHGHE